MARTAAERIKQYRKRMRAAGLREVRIWLPDMSSPAFMRERIRQSRLIARSKKAQEELSFVEALQAENIDLFE